MALQIIAASVLVLAIGWGSHRWRMLWVPVSVLLGVAAAGGTYWYSDWAGLARPPGATHAVDLDHADGTGLWWPEPDWLIKGV